MNRKVLTFVVATVCVASAQSFAGIAHADPTNNDYRQFAGVGSDTTQDVWNVLTNGNAAAGLKPVVADIASWDAFGSDTIETKPRGTAFNRPAGSGNGVKALSGAWDPANHMFQKVDVEAQLDWSRSSSAPSAACGNENQPACELSYLPFARDAVSVAIRMPEGKQTDTARVSLDQLKDIYTSCSATTVELFKTDGSTDGNISVTPYLPQSGSGSRQFFLKVLGIDNKNINTCVQTDKADKWPEHDGSIAVVEGGMVPFSVAQWISQRNGVIKNTTSAMVLAEVAGKKPVADPTAAALIPGDMFGTQVSTGTYGKLIAQESPFARDTYNVMLTDKYLGSDTTKPLNTVLSDMDDRVLGGKLEQMLNDAARSTETLNKYGFGGLSYVGDRKEYKNSPFVH